MAAAWQRLAYAASNANRRHARNTLNAAKKAGCGAKAECVSILDELAVRLMSVSLLRDTVMQAVRPFSVEAPLDDNALVLRVAQQDRQSFQALYERLSPQALGLAIRILDDRAAGEDVLHDAFVRVWNHADKFDPARGSARTWLFTIVHHMSIDALRRRRSKTTVAIDAPEHEDWDLPDEDANTHDAAMSNLSRTHVLSAMNGLPDSHRKIIELAYYKGMTHREIALHLDEPVGTVHSRVRQSMMHLKKVLWPKVADQ